MEKPIDVILTTTQEMALNYSKSVLPPPTHPGEFSEYIAILNKVANAWLAGRKSKAAEVERFRDALKFYADESTWESTTIESTRDGIGCRDFESFKLGVGEGYEQVGGRRAREALMFGVKK